MASIHDHRSWNYLGVWWIWSINAILSKWL